MEKLISFKIDTNDYYLSKYQIMTDEERTSLLNQLMSDYEQP